MDHNVVQKHRYQALALQIRTRSVGAVPNDSDARLRIQENIRRIDRLVGASVAFIHRYSGDKTQLVVLPEYSLTDAPVALSAAAWRRKAAFEPDGAEFEALGAVANRHQLFLAGNAYEADPNFPELYFQASFLISPQGNVLLRYRRLISLFSPTPYDVWDRYLDLYGLEGVFPVADTPIGRVAAIASEEILYPEIARCHAMRGAEIFIHSTSEMGMPIATPKELARRARAAENLTYLVSANAASVENTALPASSTTGMSKIIDYEGRILAEAAAGAESMIANATIDLPALRAHRRRTGLTNLLARQPFQAYAQSYAQTQFRPPNLLAELDKRRKLTRDVLERLQADDIAKLTSSLRLS
jgi:predicted amidohydrolase